MLHNRYTTYNIHPMISVRNKDILGFRCSYNECYLVNNDFISQLPISLDFFLYLITYK